MAMAPDEIKAALVLKRVKQTDIARAVGRSKQLVGDVIRRARRNAEIEKEVAARLGKSVKRVFGEAA